MQEVITQLHANLRAFEAEARGILALHETSRDRVIPLKKTRSQLEGLSLSQADLFAEAIDCLESKLYRPAIVMAWAAFMDFLEDKLISNRLSELHASFPKWTKIKSAHDLRENETDFSIIDAAATVKVLHKAEKKVLHGHLAKRNECAHPGAHRPSFNEALGYVDELLGRVGAIADRLTSK